MAPPSTPPSQPSPDQNPNPAGGGGEKSTNLESLRTRIDALDQNIVRLLNERASLVVEVGAVKRATGTPIYAPHREAAVLKKVSDANKGPLPGKTIEAVYREIMSGSFALEHPLRIGYLGPPGSYSHQAAVKQFGSSVSFEDMHEIAGVFTEVRRGHCHYGLAPIENSIGGGIVETMAAFMAGKGEINIYAEVLIEVHHALLANCEPKEIKKIYSKPEVFSQCRQWIATQFPKVELIAAPSSSRAVQIARAESDADPKSGAAAIASTLAGQLYLMDVLFERIEDDPNNITRFVVISKQHAEPTGKDKTSIMFNTPDKPGALVSVLKVFDEAGINLSHIDKRPSGRVNWSYTFFIDAVGHRRDPVLAAAIEEASTHCSELTVLGSYPVAARVL